MNKLLFLYAYFLLLPILELFIALSVGMAIMHQHTKFCWNRNNFFWDIVIFFIYNMAAGHNLGF